MAVSLSNKEKLSFITNLQTMLKAGIPVMEAVDSLLQEVKGNQRAVLVTLKEDLTQGGTIGASLEKFPKAFDAVTINLIRAAEEAGTLDTSLADLVSNIKKDIEFSSKVKSALTYPIFVIVVFFAVLLLILVFVIPRVATVFSRLKIPLPLPTKILITISNAILEYTPFFAAGFIIVIVGLFFFYKTKRHLLLRFLFSLPVLSKLALQIDLTRFARSLSLLMVSGISITDALSLSSNVVNRKDVKKALTAAKDAVASGTPLSEGFKQTKGLFPGIMIRMTEAGEKSGSLEKSMQDLTDYFETEVSTTLKTLTTLLEPIMLVVVGLLVGGMMLAIIAPIYGLIGQIGGTPR